MSGLFLKLMLSIGLPVAALGIGYFMLTSPPGGIPSDVMLPSDQGLLRFNDKMTMVNQAVKTARDTRQPKDMVVIFTEGEVNSKLKQWANSDDKKDWPINIDWARAYFSTGSAKAAVRGGVSGFNVTVLVTPTFTVTDGTLKIRVKNLEVGRLPIPKGLTATLSDFFNEQLQRLDPILPQQIPLYIKTVTFEAGQAVISGTAQ
jgi:hypothetical protein